MSKNVDQDVDFIRALASLLNESELHEIEVKREYGEADRLRVRLSRAAPPAAAPGLPAPAPMPQAAPTHATTPAPAADGADTTESRADTGHALTSPMVGTVYLSAEPGADPFVTVGDTVAEGDTVLIIEAMKTMNQIPAPRAGTVKQVLVENAEPVEFGAPLMIIE